MEAYLLLKYLQKLN